MQKVRYAPPDPALPRPWRGLVDSATSNLYFWNPDTNVTTYVRPTADPQPPHPDLDNRSDRSHQIHGVVDLCGCGDDIKNGDPSHQSQGVNRDTSSQLNEPASEAHGEEHGHKHEPTVLAKRKDTSKSHTLKKTCSKKQKTTSPPLVVDATEGHVEESIMKPTEVSHSMEKGQQECDEVHKTATEGHVEESIMKPTEVSHSVEKGQQESDEVHKTEQLAKETRNAKRKDTSKSHTLKKTYSKKQKTTSPPLVVDATERHVEESITKPTEVSHSVERGEQESDKVHKTDQLAKETRKAKRKDTSKSLTLKKTYSKKQKTSPPLVVDATEGHVEESIMKPTEVSHLVEKWQQESDEVHNTDQFVKETRKAKRKDTSKSHTLKKTYSKKQKTSPPLVDVTEGHAEELIIKPTEISHSVEKGQPESYEVLKTDQLANEVLKTDQLAKETRKRKDTSKSHTSKKTYSKKQKTSPPLVVDGHVEESIMKPTEVSHSVEKGQQESDEVLKTDQLAKETRKAKRKDTSKSHTLKKTYSKNQKSTSPSLVVDGHVEESIMKTTEVSHSVEKGQQESDEVHKTNQLVKETRKMSEVEGEAHQSASTNGAELLQANRSKTFEMNVISSICTTLVAKETGNSLHEELPILGTGPNQELLSVADGPQGLGEEIIDRDGLMDQDGGPIIDNLLNYSVDCPTIDSTQIEANLEKQPIKRSFSPSIHKVEEDLALSESIDRLAGVTDQLFGAVEAMRYMIQYTVSARETDVQRRRENEGLKKNVVDLKKKVADLEAKLKDHSGG